MSDSLTVTRRDFNWIVESVAAINARGRKQDLQNRDLALIYLNNVAVKNGDNPFTGIEVCATRAHATALLSPPEAPQ